MQSIVYALFTYIELLNIKSQLINELHIHRKNKLYINYIFFSIKI